MAEQNIFEIIQAGDFSALRDRIAENPAIVNQTNPTGVRPVMFARYMGQAEMVSYISPVSEPFTFFEAAALGELETVRRTVSDQREVINAFSPDGFTALHLAAFFSQPAIALYLIAHGAGVNLLATNGSRLRPIHSAVAGKNIEIVRALLHNKAEVNHRQSGGFTALHAAVQIGNIEMVRLLLTYGADRTVKADDGKLPVDFASGENKAAIDDLLQ